MKRVLKYVVVLAAGLMATACSEDYLNTVPSYAVSDGLLQEDVANYAGVINGISHLMVAQQGNYGQGYCGLSTVQIRLGDLCGNDAISQAVQGFNSANMALCNSNSAAYGGYSWWFFYNVIGNANRILDTIDDAEGDDKLRALYKAQALTYRAFAYTYLVQIFSKRWMDSSNGSTPGVVLRTEASTDAMPRASLAECYAQIYKDCDEAISLFGQSGQSVSEFDLPSLNMAWGVKARAALAREDWDTAATAAHNARAGHPLMSQDDFMDGFCYANDEWIYGGVGRSDENKWYYSFGNYHAYNGYYSIKYGYSTVASRELVDAFNDTDVRKQLFLHQNLFDIPFTYTVDGKGTLGTYARVNTATREGVALGNAMLDYIFDNPTLGGYCELTGAYPSVPSAYGQLKFAVFDLPGVSNQCFMRAAEMYLTEAEALCKKASADEAGARALLNELNGARDNGYTATSASGQALIDEIMLTRRMELWGEGHAWFDLKRTGQPIVRKLYSNKAADGTIDGTFHPSWYTYVGPNDAGSNDWVWTIPLDETEYNDQI